MNSPIGLLKRSLSHFATKVARKYARPNPSNNAGIAWTQTSAETTSLDRSMQWLQENRLERMDATVEIFDPKRREFHLDRYRFAARRVRGRQVLDCACGTGYGVRLLREIGSAASVVGIDVDDKAIRYACQKHQINSATFICSSGECLPLADNSVDIVTSFETVEHVPDDVALVEDFYRVLRPSGTLIISTPNQWPLKDAPFHVREYDRKAFANLLEPCFHCVEFYNQNSGCATPHNHDQSRGIVATTSDNEHLAECYLVVCRRKS